MNKEIAVLMGFGQATCSLREHGRLVVFSWQQGVWQVSRKIACMVPAGSGAQELRARLPKIIYFLGECKIFVGLNVNGILYYELAKNDCSVWEVAGRPEQFLDDLWFMELLLAVRRKHNAARNVAPVSVGAYCGVKPFFD